MGCWCCWWFWCRQRLSERKEKSASLIEQHSADTASAANSASKLSPVGQILPLFLSFFLLRFNYLLLKVVPERAQCAHSVWRWRWLTAFAAAAAANTHTHSCSILANNYAMENAKCVRVSAMQTGTFSLSLLLSRSRIASAATLMQLNQDNGHWMAFVYWRSTLFWGWFSVFFGKRSFDESVLVQKTKQQQQQWRASFFVVTRYWVSRPSFFSSQQKKIGNIFGYFHFVFPNSFAFQCNVCVCACGVHGRNQGREKKKNWMLEWIASRIEFETLAKKTAKWNETNRGELELLLHSLRSLYQFCHFSSSSSFSFSSFLVARLFSLFSLFVCLYVVVCLCLFFASLGRIY